MADGYWQGKHVLITGATGLLGSWVTRYLVDEGSEVVILERDNVPQSLLYSSGTIDRVRSVRGDLIDYSTLVRAINEYEIDTIFHLGAQTLVTIANSHPISTFDANIRGSWNLLEAARVTESVERIAFASSDKAYGPQEKLPYTEDSPLSGRWPYDVSKSAADLIAQSYFHTYGLPVGITRCGNFYGGGDLNFNRIVPGTIRSIHEKKAPQIRSDGTPIRDYFYIEDGVHAYTTMAKALDEKKFHGEAFNFSSGEILSVIDLTNRIIKLMKSDLQPEILAKASGEIDKQYLSNEKAKTQLNWKSLFTLDEGLQRTIEWYTRFLSDN